MWTKKEFSKLIPKLGTYPNGRIAIQYEMLAEEEPLKSMSWMEPVCTATINLPEYPVGEGEVIIKTYSENEGLYECMLEAGHIGPAIKYIQSGFITAPVCKLLLKP